MTPRRINRVSLALLAAGFTAALVIAAFAPPPESDGFRADPLGQKRYRRELRVIGGQANQLSADFLEWWADRWVGPNLAYTVAVLTLAATGVFRFVAVRLTPPDDPGRPATRT